MMTFKVFKTLNDRHKIFDYKKNSLNQKFIPKVVGISMALKISLNSTRKKL